MMTTTLTIDQVPYDPPISKSDLPRRRAHFTPFPDDLEMTSSQSSRLLLLGLMLYETISS